MKFSAPFKSSLLVCLLTVSASSIPTAQAATVEEIALMKSPNREKILIEGAKKEGKVSFYTGLIVDQVVRPVKDAFEKEYPFLQVEFFRANADRLAQRVLSEHQAKRYEVDVASGSAAATMLQRAGLMQRFYSPPIAEYPRELKDPNGFWGSTNVYFMTLGYNTRNVKAAELPKSYEDLLNPRWKGQMMWSTSRGSGAPQFIGNILVSMGQEAGKTYLQKLKQQNIAKSTASARQMAELFHLPGVVVFDDDIGFGDQLLSQVGALWVFQIEHDAFFVLADPEKLIAVDFRVGRHPRAAKAVASGRFDLDDLRSQMAEQHGAERAVECMSKIDHANVVECAGHGYLRQ